MNLRNFILPFILTSTLSLTAPAFANGDSHGDRHGNRHNRHDDRQSYNNYSPFEAFYTTSGKHDTTPTTVFSWNEKPWVYAKFLDTSKRKIGDNAIGAQWSWGAPLSDVITFKQSNKNEVWFSLTDNQWNNIKRAGTWSISSFGFLNNYCSFGGDSFIGQTTFQVHSAPEPISSILFLTGGLTMAGGLLKKRKKLTV